MLYKDDELTSCAKRKRSLTRSARCAVCSRERAVRVFSLEEIIGEFPPYPDVPQTYRSCLRLALAASTLALDCCTSMIS